jgi:hypothetical protein
MAEAQQQAVEEIVPGSEEYNAAMANKFTNQAELGKDADQPDAVPVPDMPDGGYEKFYNKETGEYDWQNHAKEVQYRLDQLKKGEEPDKVNLSEEERNEALNTPEYQAVDIVTRAGLNPDEIRQQLETSGDLSEEAYEALEKQGLRRELVELYVDNLNYRREQQTQQALDYAGGEQEWNSLASWAAQNLEESEVNRYNELLGTPEWKVAIDALRVRRDSSYGEPKLINGNNMQAGSTFGYRSKSEMKADMSDPRYTKDPAFRQQVMQKIQSATWDMDAL